MCACRRRSCRCVGVGRPAQTLPAKSLSHLLSDEPVSCCIAGGGCDGLHEGHHTAAEDPDLAGAGAGPHLLAPSLDM